MKTLVTIIVLLCISMFFVSCDEDVKAKSRGKNSRQSRETEYLSHEYYDFTQNHALNSETVHVPHLCPKCIADREQLKKEIIEEVKKEFFDKVAKDINVKIIKFGDQ